MIISVMRENTVLRTAYMVSACIQNWESNLNTWCVDVKKYGGLLESAVSFIFYFFLIQFQEQCERFYKAFWFNVMILITLVIISRFSVVKSIYLALLIGWPMVLQWCVFILWVRNRILWTKSPLLYLNLSHQVHFIHQRPWNRLQDKNVLMSRDKQGRLYKWTAFLKILVSWTRHQTVLW